MLGNHMEPIEEEKSELAMDIAAVVVEKLDIDRKLDEKMQHLMLRGDRIFRDIQIRQEQSMEALARTVGMCLESQRAFHEEHQRLLKAVKELATMVVPLTGLSGQASEAQARASAIAEDAEALNKRSEDSHISAASAMAAAITPASVPLPTLHTQAAAQPGAGGFSVTLRKADDVSLGLSVNADDKEGHTLVVESVLAGGAVESWNRQCFGDGSEERIVVAGDRIIRVNNIEKDVQKMLEECSKQRLVKLFIARAQSITPTITHALASASLTPEKMRVCANLTPEKVVQPRCLNKMEPPASISNIWKSPEFVTSKPAPLQQTQVPSAPPGVFLPTFADFAAPTRYEDNDGSDKEN